jgi:D-alanine-D-alanine ligase
MDRVLDPTTIAVIRGGNLQHNHSLKTGSTFLQSLRSFFSKKQQGDVPIKDIYIDKEGNWHLAGFRSQPHDALKGVTFAVNAMHGEYGADGKLQRLLESLGITYTGSGASESAISAHHGWLKRSHAQNGFQSPRYLTLSSDDDPRERASYIFNHFHMPVVLLPTRFGRRNEAKFEQRYDLLPNTIADFIERHGTAVVEEYINGKQVYVPVVEHFREKALYTPVIVEERKEDGSFVQIQGLSDELKERLSHEAVRVHKELGYRHLSQQKFIVTARGKTYLIDSETHPPIHAESPIGVAFSAVGAEPDTLAIHIADLALSGR